MGRASPTAECRFYSYRNFCEGRRIVTLREPEFAKRLRLTDSWKTGAIGEGERSPRSEGRSRTYRGFVLHATDVPPCANPNAANAPNAEEDRRHGRP